MRALRAPASRCACCGKIVMSGRESPSRSNLKQPRVLRPVGRLRPHPRESADHEHVNVRARTRGKVTVRQPANRHSIATPDTLDLRLHGGYGRLRDWTGNHEERTHMDRRIVASLEVTTGVRLSGGRSRYAGYTSPARRTLRRPARTFVPGTPSQKHPSTACRLLVSPRWRRSACRSINGVQEDRYSSTSRKSVTYGGR